MALPALLLGAIRGAAALGSGAATSSAAKNIGRAKSLEGMIKGIWNLQLRQQQQRIPTLSAGAFPATREQFQQTAKHFGTPNPSQGQIAQFAQSQQQVEGQEKLGATVGNVVKTVTGFGLALTSARLLLRDWSQSIEDSVLRLKDFSPSIGAAKARFDVAELRRTQREAQATGGTTSALLRARQNRLDATQPMEVLTTNISNLVRTGVTNLQTGFFRLINPFIEKLNDFVDTISDLFGLENDRDQRFQGPFKDFLKKLGTQPENPHPREIGGRGGEGRF